MIVFLAMPPEHKHVDFKQCVFPFVAESASGYSGWRTYQQLP